MGKTRGGIRLDDVAEIVALRKKRSKVLVVKFLNTSIAGDITIAIKKVKKL